MKSVKQQWIDPLFEKYRTPQTNQSAFRPFKLEAEEKHDIDMSFDIETYINKRKFQNSFTLSDITVSSLVTKKEHIKIQSSKQTSVTAEPQQQKKEQTQIKQFSIISQVQYSHRPEISRIKRRQLCPRSVSVKIVPCLKQFKTFGVQVQINKEKQVVKKQLTIEELYTEDQGTPEKIKVQIPKKSKKQRKNQKIQLKKHQEVNKRYEKSHENESNKQFKKLEEKRFPKEEKLLEFPFEGVLRNCSCCGKLISKLCFKCPHIYCNAQNCPRKRKKLLNEKMLQKMKQQKIKEHYRQRELYQKMKLQKEGTLNPKFIQPRKPGLRNQRKKESNENKSRKQRKHLIQVSSNEWKTSEEEFNSQLFYDSESDNQKRREKKKLFSSKNRNDEKNVQEKIKLEHIVKKEVNSQKDKEKDTKIKKIKEQAPLQENKQRQLQKMDSFSMSLFLQSDESNQKGQNRLTRKDVTAQMFDEKSLKQQKTSLQYLRNQNRKERQKQFYFDSDLESTF